ncbi:MAG TPA: MFS transporter [Thermomicrobiales bacterium]|nr:MFS transporter [Thermomicrobiales bacterium]
MSGGHGLEQHADTQRRVVRVLAASQVLGGIGAAAGAAVGASLAADLATESLSGLSASASVIGSALMAIPVSRIMQQRGRRPGLAFAYLVGMAGAVVIVIGALLDLFPLALLGVVATGSGMTAGLQSRYAATDLAAPGRRGRSLATVVWATTIGSILGPNLAAPMGSLAGSIGIPRLAGPYLLTVVVYGAAAAIISLLLHPDPLLVARDTLAGPAARRAGLPGTRQLGGTGSPVKPGSVRDALDTIRTSSAAVLGLASVVIGHAVMVAIMSMTPVHLQNEGASLEIVGVIISAHITGMYIASPLVGAAADRYGRQPVMVVGGGLLLAACAFAGTATGHAHAQLGIGLTLLGLGWSCTLIAGSTLVTESVPVGERPSVQGSTDLLMGIAGASAGLASGLVVGFGSYALLSLIAACLVVPLIFRASRPLTARPALS